ncbi:MAG: hypothetical protein OEM38_12615 [Gammaproteobacteria bacterium]|nr:hypothetical protein [Gammaproteobacteria bacterium]
MKKIFNFDHGLTAPTELKVGPFTVKIFDYHCSNLKKLHRKSSLNKTFDNNSIERVIVRNDKVSGGFVETAIVHWDKYDISGSILFPETPNGSKFYDLLVMLSFLTGRRVYQGNRSMLTFQKPPS